MSFAHIVRESPVVKTARVIQLCGMFDVPPAEMSRVEWDVTLPLDERPWNLGLIVGPSGSGKSTVARELFEDAVVSGFDWPTDKSVVDGFPAAMSIKHITGLLSSVGFSSPPNWLRPFHVLSNGEQFRVTLARALAENQDLAVLDEFTSVVDRTVAQMGSAAIAKTVRKRGQQLIAVSCHYDIIEWLQPDWIYQPATNDFEWRRLQRRPAITLTVSRVGTQAWDLFKKHHYLTATLAPSARCFLACVGDRPAAFTSVMPFAHPRRAGWRIHRTVCLPDFQGVGIGNALVEYVAGLYRATGRPVFSTTGHPAMIAHRARSPLWHMHRLPGRTARKQGPHTKIKSLNRTVSSNRLTAGCEFVGEARTEEAQAFGLM